MFVQFLRMVTGAGASVRGHAPGASTARLIPQHMSLKPQHASCIEQVSEWQEPRLPSKTPSFMTDTLDHSSTIICSCPSLSNQDAMQVNPTATCTSGEVVIAASPYAIRQTEVFDDHVSLGRSWDSQ